MSSVLPVPPSAEVVVGPSATPRVPQRGPSSASAAGLVDRRQYSTRLLPGSYLQTIFRAYVYVISEASRPSRARIRLPRGGNCPLRVVVQGELGARGQPAFG